MTFLNTFVVAIALSAQATGTATAAPTFPIAHRALYEISAAPDTTGEVTDLQGIEAVEWTLDCEGASLFQRTSLVASLAGGFEYRTDAQMTVWEAADASRMRFMMTVDSTDETKEEVSGLAERRANGQVAVRYSRPDVESRTLPARVFFPWQFSREVKRVAESGGRGHSATVLRGNRADIDPAVIRTQVVTKKAIPAAVLSRMQGDTSLLGTSAWTFASAVFEEPEESVPTFELSESVSESGIRLSAEMHFPDMTLKFRLRLLEKLPVPVCN